MRLFSLVLVLTALMAGALSAETAKDTSVSRQLYIVPADEMRVLASYLRWSVDPKGVTVLLTTTEGSSIDIDYINLKLAISGHGTPSDVRSDLKAKLDLVCQIPPIAGIRGLRLISQEDRNQLFQKRTGWSNFHRRNCRDARLVTISRVGFNAEKTIALFYATDGIGRMAGGCSLYVFRLRKGAWVKESEAPAWQT
jgi:hypothetical protein